MNEGKLAEFWSQAQYCYFKAEEAKGPASKHLWIQLARDWVALADPIVLQSNQQNDDGSSEQLDPFIAPELFEPRPRRKPANKDFRSKKTEEVLEPHSDALSGA